MDSRAPAVKVLVSAQTDVGRARKTNEDACSITELESGTVIDARGADHTLDVGHKGLLLAVSDGMGGHQAGEVASALVIESLSRELTQDKQGPLHKQLEDAVHRTNRRVHNAARSAERHGMGATLTAVFIRGTEAYVAEVGDSRGYLLRNGRLRQITRDQSMVQLLVDQGVMSREDARRSPGKNVILQAVGLGPDVRVAIGRLELRRGDRLMLCSDGVTNQVADDELRELLTKSEPRAACEKMITLANERGGEDNETVIVADVLGEDLAEVDEYETVTSTFEVLQAFEARPKGSKRRSAAGPAVGSDGKPVETKAKAETGKAITPAAGTAKTKPVTPAAGTKATTEGAGKPESGDPDAGDPQLVIEGEASPSDATPLVAFKAPASTSQEAAPRGWLTSLLGRLGIDRPKR